MNYDEYIKGSIVGLSHTLLGHPLDTLKILKQNNILRFHSIKQHPLSLLRGIRYPMFVSVGYNSSLFGLYTDFKKQGFNDFNAGFLSGSILSFFLNPFDLYKIRTQTSKTKIYIHTLNPFIGLKYTFARDSLSSGLYFYTYKKCKQNHISPFISGGFAGILSWITTYPIDTINTRCQKNISNPHLSLKSLIQQGGLWQGVTFCLLRAFLVNGTSFYIYEHL